MQCTKEKIKLKNIDGESIDVIIYHFILTDMSKLKDKIEASIINICCQNMDYSIDDVKRYIYNLISTKTDLQKHGICAEFFMHLCLRDLGYIQKCVFSNLEENSMKKGFDGFYEYSNDFWIAESKCGITVVKHKDKIKDALKDLDEKVSTTNGNNPWWNAYTHILVSDNGSKNESLLKKVKKLSKEYVNKISHNSYEFNLIPSSTLFVNTNQQDSEIKREIEIILKDRKIKNMIILCIDNNIYDEFCAYFERK